MNLVRYWAFKLLDFYLAIRFKRSFHDVKIDLSKTENKIDLDRSIVLIANHSSWWDGFFAYQIFKKLNTDQKFKIVMLESELQKRPFFRLCGAVGLIPKDRSHNLKIFHELKNHFVCFFPQGELTPQNLRPLVFKPGINTLIQTLHPVQILSAAFYIEPFRFMKPTALIKVGSVQLSQVDQDYSVSLAEVTEKHLDDISCDWVKNLYRLENTPWKV